MPNALFSVPKAVNETVLSYAPGSPERGRLLKTYEKMLGEEVDIPMFIGGREVEAEAFGNAVRPMTTSE